MAKHIFLMSHKMNLGGTEKSLLAFINALKGKDIAITLLLVEPGGVLFNEIPQWVKVEILADFDTMKPIIFDPPLHLIKSNIKQLQFISAIKNTIRYIKVKTTGNWYLNYIAVLKNTPIQYPADMAIAFAGPSDFITYYVYKCVEAPIKHQWIHFDVSKVIFNTNFGNKFYPHFNTIFCVSENAQLVFNRMFPKFSHKTEVFKNIISKSKLEALALSGDTYADGFSGLRILTLGRLSEEKGQQLIPNIVSKLKQDGINFRWYLIGDGHLTTSIKNQISELNIEKELVLLGSKLNPYGFVKDCDLYVQTSFHEGYCLTVHEAKIFNKPVVITNVASAPNLIAHNTDGFIVDISEEAIYQGVKTLLLDTNLRKRFQKNCLAQETVNEINKLQL